MNEKELIEQYRIQLERSNDQAPEDLWNDIANNLDIDDVWNNIAAELDSEERSRPITWINKYWAASILFLLSLALSGLWYMNENKQPITKKNDFTINSKKASGTKNEQPITKINNLSTSKLIVTDLNKYKEDKDSKNYISINKNSDKKINSSNYQVEINDIQRITLIKAGGSSLDTLYSQQIAISQTNIDGESKQFQKLYQAVPNDIQKIAPIQGRVLSLDTLFFRQIYLSQTNIDGRSKSVRKLYGGITTSVKNTWLYSDETINGFSKSNPTTNGINIYLDFGINLMYELGSRWRAEGTMFIKSKTGQSYKKYLYGRFIDKDITLNYTQLEISAKYISTKHWIRSDAFYFTNSFGLYYSKLNSSAFKSSIYLPYNNYDYGIVLGNNIDFLLLNRVILSPGYRIKCGITNIYAGENGIPASLNKTHNVSLEFRITLYYTILK